MPLIHSTAIIEPGAELAESVQVGPWCHVGGEVRLGEGVRLHSHVVIDGRTTVGEGAVLFPFCSVGLAPQDLKYAGEPTSCSIGARTQLREHVTVHRGTVTGRMACCWRGGMWRRPAGWATGSASPTTW